MNALLGSISHHGYLLLFLLVLAEALGFPVPAAIGLVAAGAAAAAHIVSIPAVLATAIVGMMIGDVTLFVLGRYMGWALLGVLCRLSLNPETCIFRSAESFYKHGKVTLLFAKFIPGVNTMAPPLAGSMKMRLEQFLRLDFLGASFYILAYWGLGFIFRDFLGAITRGIQNASHVVAEIIVAAIVAFVVYRIVQYRRFKLTDVVPRIAVDELARREAIQGNSSIVVDVRSHGYYDSGAERIAGSIRIEPNRLAEELRNLPKDKEIYLYCT